MIPAIYQGIEETPLILILGKDRGSDSVGEKGKPEAINPKSYPQSRDYFGKHFSRYKEEPWIFLDLGKNSKMEKRIRKPLAIGEILNFYYRKMGISRKMHEQKILDAWKEVVGEGVAKRTEPIRIENRVLFLKVSNSVWMQQLQFMKEFILKKLHEKTGIDLLQDLRFFIGEVEDLDRGKNGERPKRGLPPLSESDLQIIHREVSGIQDPEIKKILSELYSRALAVERNRRSKGNIES